MLDRISHSLHERMINQGVTAPSVPVIIYALKIIVNTAGIVGLSLLAGWATGHFAETIIVLAVFGVIRFISGGYHLRSGAACILVSSCLIVGIPFIALSERLTLILTAAALVFMLNYAPANYDKYARIDPKYFPLLKGLACLIVASNFLIQSDLLAVIYTIQAITLPFKEEG